MLEPIPAVPPRTMAARSIVRASDVDPIASRVPTGLRSDWRGQGRRSFLRRTGDLFTLGGVALLPSYGLSVAGATYGDAVLGLAALVRVLQFVTEGLPIFEMRRHGFVLGVFSLFAAGGAISGLVIGNPLPWTFLRILIATFGSVLIVTSYGTSRRDLIPLLRAFALGCLVLAISGMVGKHSGGRAQGYSIHPNLFAHSCAMGVAAATYLFDLASKRGERILWLTCIACCIWGVLLSGSRGTLIGLWVGATLYLILSGDRRARAVALGATYVAVLALASGGLKLPDSNPIERLQTEGVSLGRSNHDRRLYLEANLNDIAAAPVFGKGFDNSIVLIHVVYLQGWVAGGVVCAFSLMLFGLIMVVLPLGQARQNLALACGASTVAVAWLFTTVLTPRDQWLFLVLVFWFCDLPGSRPGTLLSDRVRRRPGLQSAPAERLDPGR